MKNSDHKERDGPEELIKFVKTFLKENNFVFSSKKNPRDVSDPNYSCFYFRFKNDSTSEKQLSIVYNKKDNMIMFGILNVEEDGKLKKIMISDFLNIKNFKEFFLKEIILILNKKP